VKRSVLTCTPLAPTLRSDVLISANPPTATARSPAASREMPSSVVRLTRGKSAGHLYDLDADPAETRNVWNQHPDIAARLRASLDRIRSGTVGRGPSK
jgi:hypothetical protein